MASQVTNNLPSRPKPQKLPTPKTAAPKGLTKLNKAPGLGQASGAANGIAGQAAQAVPSAYEIMAGRIANRVAEMAENITFVERYVFASYAFVSPPQRVPKIRIIGILCTHSY